MTFQSKLGTSIRQGAGSYVHHVHQPAGRYRLDGEAQLGRHLMQRLSWWGCSAPSAPIVDSGEANSAATHTAAAGGGGGPWPGDGCARPSDGGLRSRTPRRRSAPPTAVPDRVRGTAESESVTDLCSRWPLVSVQPVHVQNGFYCTAPKEMGEGLHVVSESPRER